MALFAYKGVNANGREIKASITAESESLAKVKLKQMGIMLLDIKEEKSKNKNESSFSILSSVSIKDLSLMTRQLATLTRAKVQLVEALSALVNQTDSPQLKIILSEVRSKVNEGVSLSKAFADYPKVFDNVFVNMVDAGEASGTLETVLIRLADFKESQVSLKNKIKGAMTYPIIMVLIGTIMMGIIFIFVIPKITKIFISMKKELPLQTKICIWISEFLQSYWYLVIFSAFAFWWIIQKYIRTKDGEKNWHKIILKLPIIGELATMINVSRFCSTLATLLNSGVPILASLKIVKNIVTNVHMQHAVELARESIQEGGSISDPLKKSGYFPSMVTHMITLGEKSGELEPMLEIVSKSYEDEVDTKLSGLTSVLEPIMMVGMGLAVAFIVFSVVVPMMDLNSLH
jgi:general secretion pathway protein F